MFCLTWVRLVCSCRNVVVDRYGEYGHEKRSPPSVYEKFWDEAVGFRYSHRVSEAIADEMRACRESVALFDYSAAGKVHLARVDSI